MSKCTAPWLSRPRHPDQGFTLVEIMFSIFILAVAVTTVMGLLAAGARRQGLERDREVANQLAVAIAETAYFAPAAQADVIEAALVAPNSVIRELPAHLVEQIRSPDGSLERALALNAKIVYLGTHEPTGNIIDPLQLRVIAALVTPDNGNVVPADPNWSPSLACRTLVCWSADWMRLYESEDNGSGGHVDRNNSSVLVGERDYGPLSPGSYITAVEVGRFNLYNPHQPLTLRGAP